MNNNASNSLFREKICELGFLAELYNHCWKQKEMQLDTLKPDIDHSGYDLIVIIKNKLNFVQLKSISRTSTTQRIKFHSSILSKEKAYMVLIVFSDEDQKLEFHCIPLSNEEMSNYTINRYKDSEVNLTISVASIKRASRNRRTIQDIFEMFTA